MKKYPELKFAFCPSLEVVKTAEGKDEWLIRGYAATSDLDRQNDVITPEALKKAVEDLKANTTVFYEHKHDQPPVGKILNAGTDEKGLWVEVMISKTRADIWQLIQEGILSKFSIGGKLKEASKMYNRETNREFNQINDLEILEVSIVGLPANREAGFEPKSFIGGVCKALEGASPVETDERREQPVEDKTEVKKDATVEAPKVETPAAAPVAEVPKEEPKVEPAPVEPKAEEPKVEPKVEPAKVEEPKVEAPKVEEPKVEAPKAEEPKVEAPKAEEPKVEKAADAPQVIAPVNDVKQKSVEDQIAALDKKLDTVLAKLDAVAKVLEQWNVAEEPEVTPAPAAPAVEKNLTIEEITTVVEKSLDAKLGKIRLVPSRKGTIIKTDLDLKEDAEGDEDVAVLNDEEKFSKLPKEKQTQVIRKGFASLFKS